MRKIKKIFQNPLFFIFLVLTLAFLLFSDLWNIYFFQDDFFTFSISHARSLKDFFTFFIPRTDIQYYRPLSHQLFYFFLRFVFDLNPFFYHLTSLIFFYGGVYFVYRLATKFIKNKILQLFFLLFYTTSSIHYDSLFWIANFSYILVAFLYFFGFLIFLAKIKNKSYYLILIYILGLLSNELMITFPIILSIYSAIFTKGKVKKIPGFFPLLFVTLVYFFIRIIFPPDTTSYPLKSGLNIISALRWFFLFFLNWSESIKDYMITLFSIKENFIRSFSNVWQLYRLNLVVFTFTFIVVPILLLIKKTKEKIFAVIWSKEIRFSLFWAIITLLPVVFFPLQISPHRGVLGFFGFLLLIFSIWDKIINIKKSLLYYFLICTAFVVFIYTSYTTIKLNNRLHWIVRRSEIVKYWLQKVKKNYPDIQEDTVVFIDSDEYKVKVALSEGRAIREYFQQSSVNVVFK